MHRTTHSDKRWLYLEDADLIIFCLYILLPLADSEGGPVDAGGSGVPAPPANVSPRRYRNCRPSSVLPSSSLQLWGPRCVFHTHGPLWPFCSRLRELVMGETIQVEVEVRASVVSTYLSEAFIHLVVVFYWSLALRARMPSTHHTHTRTHPTQVKCLTQEGKSHPMTFKLVTNDPPPGHEKLVIVNLAEIGG
jgi:hypothetical protein